MQDTAANALARHSLGGGGRRLIFRLNECGITIHQLIPILNNAVEQTEHPLPASIGLCYYAHMSN